MNWKIIQIGIKNLLLHKLRSLLTLLGVILGVGSVIAMLAVGEGSKKEALERIRGLGAENVIIRSVKPVLQDSDNSGSRNEEGGVRRVSVLQYGLRHEDLERFKSNLPTVKQTVPVALVTCEASEKAASNPQC